MPDTEMVKIADYCSVIKGKIGIKKALKGKYPLVTTAEERLSHNEYHFDRPSVIIPLVSSTGHGHASLKRIHFQEGKFAVGSILCTVTPNAQFLYHYLDVYKEKLLVSRMRGMANVTLPVTEIENVEFPLLSTDKQKEWVSLFENASSYTDGLTSEIDYQQSLLKKFRQSILQDAISGKLTEKWRRDNPDVEPATELLARIKEEKERLVKEKKIKKQKPLPSITEDEIPFELPEGWVWTRLGEILNEFLGGYSFKSPLFKKSGINQVLRLGNIRPDLIRFDKKPIFIDDDLAKEAGNAKLKPNDLLITMTGTRGKKDYCYTVLLNDVHFSDRVLFLNQRVGCFRLNNMICNKYFNYALKDNGLLKQIFSTATGSANQANIGAASLNSWIVPLTPQKEAEIIVSKVGKLFIYFDELEQQIGKSQQDSELLMQAVLKEAFES